MRKFTFLLLLSALMLGDAMTSHPAGAQEPSAVGGSGTFDNSHPNSGSSPRRRLNSPLAAVPEDFAILKIAPGFLLSMEVYDAPEFSNDLRVDTDGNVTIPLIGQVKVAGDTVDQAAAEISKRLKDGKILNNPQVHLNVSQYAGQNITVLGEVNNPGRIELLAPHTIAEVVAQAGGATQYAGSTIEILRREAGTSRRVTVRYSRTKGEEEDSPVLILPGDTVTVARAGIVYLLGAVHRPGGYVMQEDGNLNVTQALALASGTEMMAAVGSMRLIRRMPDGKVTEMPIPYGDIVKGKIPPPKLQAEDVIYVPVSKTKTIFTTGILSSTATAAIYAGIAH
jgi:polysaccharide export outer membrane protein